MELDVILIIASGIILIVGLMYYMGYFGGKNYKTVEKSTSAPSSVPTVKTTPNTTSALKKNLSSHSLVRVLENNSYVLVLDLNPANAKNVNISVKPFTINGRDFLSVKSNVPLSITANGKIVDKTEDVILIEPILNRIYLSGDGKMFLVIIKSYTKLNITIEKNMTTTSYTIYIVKIDPEVPPTSYKANIQVISDANLIVKYGKIDKGILIYVYGDIKKANLLEFKVTINLEGSVTSKTFIVKSKSQTSESPSLNTVNTSAIVLFNGTTYKFFIPTTKGGITFYSPTFSREYNVNGTKYVITSYKLIDLQNMIKYAVKSNQLIILNNLPKFHYEVLAPNLSVKSEGNISLPELYNLYIEATTVLQASQSNLSLAILKATSGINQKDSLEFNHIYVMKVKDTLIIVNTSVENGLIGVNVQTNVPVITVNNSIIFPITIKKIELIPLIYYNGYLLSEPVTIPVQSIVPKDMYQKAEITINGENTTYLYGVTNEGTVLSYVIQHSGVALPFSSSYKTFTIKAISQPTVPELAEAYIEPPAYRINVTFNIINNTVSFNITTSKPVYLILTGNLSTNSPNVVYKTRTSIVFLIEKNASITVYTPNSRTPEIGTILLCQYSPFVPVAFGNIIIPDNPVIFIAKF